MIYENSICALALVTHGWLPAGFPCRWLPSPAPHESLHAAGGVRAAPGRNWDRRARGAAAYSHPFTVLAEQQHLNLVLHLIPSLEEVSIFHWPQVVSGLTAHLVTDRNELTPPSTSTPCFVVSHLQPSGKKGLLVQLLRYHRKIRGAMRAHLRALRNTLPAEKL